MCPDQSKTGHVTDKCIKLIRKKVNTSSVTLACVALGSSGHKKKRAREKETREGRGEPVLSFARYFQAPATQATETQEKNVVAREGSHNGGLILMIDMFYNNNDDLLLRMKTTCKVFHSRPFSRALIVRVYCS